MQWKKIINTVILFCFISGLHGCYTRYNVTQSKLEEFPDQNISEVITKYGDVYVFPEGARLIGDAIFGYADNGEFVEIPLEEINLICSRKLDHRKTGLYVLGFAALVGLVYITAMLIALSTMDW